jgi:hypothetical protein
VSKVSDPQPAQEERTKAPPAEPEIESTLDKLNRGALPPDDPLVRVTEAILGLRSLIKS